MKTDRKVSPTISRHLLDERLNETKDLVRGAVLDIGGEKEFSIGNFKRPDVRWYCLNINERYRPDVLAACYYLPFLDMTFNTVFLCELLEHLRTPEIALDETVRVLRPNGRLFLTMPFLYRHHQNPHDYQRWTHEKIYEELNKRGLEIEVFVPRGGWLATLLDIFTQGITAFNPGTFTGSRLLYIAGRFIAWAIRKSYPVWIKIDRFLSREEVTKSNFHRFTTGYFVVAKKIDKQNNSDSELNPDILRFPKDVAGTTL